VSDEGPIGAEAEQDLRDRLRDLVEQLRSEQGESIPAEPYLRSSSALKGAVKRGIFRLTRPATRRSDRLSTELAAVSLELAERVGEIVADLQRARGDLDRLDRAIVELQASASTSTGRANVDGAPVVDDSYYWAFEQRMRGDASSVLARLRRYERFAVTLREGLAAEGAASGGPPPLWLDLGCGLGEFCELVREWGWRAHGVDSSPGAVEACRAKGIDATLAEVDGYLETRRGEAPGAISAIQLIEHVPRAGWIPLFERIHATLRPGGAMLIETINGLNPEAVASYFVADVTHTWPGHPETLRLMAEHAGFQSVEVVFLNDDHRGSAQDFAIWAHKADDV
jgi:SAM-dependent methyltransferase